MSGSNTAHDSDHTIAMRKLCESINKDLVSQGIYHWVTKYRVWADPQRAENANGTISAVGDNITDVDLFLVMPDGAFVPCFCIGGDNLHDPSVLCDMSMIDAVMDDIGGGNARMNEPDGTRMTITHVLKNFGKYFGHLGVKEDCNMLGNFKDCTFRVQVHVVELEVGQTLADLEEGQLMMYVQNYHSRWKMAANLNFLFTAQGVSACTDDSPPGIPVPLYLQGMSEDDGKLHNYAIGIEATKRAFTKTGKQSVEEKIEQVERGRSAESKLGPNDPNMPEMCAVIHGQVPCVRKAMKPAVINPSSLIAAAMDDMSDWAVVGAMPKYTSLCAAAPLPVVSTCVLVSTDAAMEDDDDFEHVEPTVRYSGLSDSAGTNATAFGVGTGKLRSLSAAPHSSEPESPKYRGVGPDVDEMEEEEEHAPVTRSLSTPLRSPAHKKSRPSVPPPPAQETCRAASTHKGKDMGLCTGLSQTDLEPDDSGARGIPTFTFSIFMVKPKGTDLGTQDVKNAIEFAEKVRKCAGTAHVRNHKIMNDAGATSKALSVQAAVEIAETMKAIQNRARKSNVPVAAY